MVGAVGLEVGAEVIKNRSNAQKIQEMLGGKATHPVCGIPGGMSKPLSEDERKKVEEYAKEMVEFSKFTMQVFTDVVLKNKDYLAIITNPDIFYQETYNLGTVDKNDKVNFYDGTQVMIDPDGKEVRQVHRHGLPEVHRRAHRALELREVLLLQAGRLEGIRGRKGLRHLPRHAALPLQRLEGLHHAAGAGRTTSK